jgi:uncharacterized protein
LRVKISMAPPPPIGGSKKVIYMDKELIIEKTRQYVKEKLEGEGTGHDWWHTERVWKTSIYIGKNEKADLFVVQLAALLHDISDWKFSGGDDKAGAEVARKWLEQLGVNEKIISQICHIIQEISFKGAKVESKIKTTEGKVVQDADRLDAIGAIGIARAFAYGGYKGREIYNPKLKPEYHTSFEEYKNKKGPTINHFYEKLLLLKDLMNTETGKMIAEKRHKYMVEFLNRFFREIELEDF